MKILIIEDDLDNAQSVTDAAEDAGFTVRCTHTAREGLQAFEEENPDVVLTDLVLPDIDGIGVLQQIRKSDDSVPVILMTAYGSVESGVRAMREGAYDYVTKPLDLDDIQSKIRRAAETSTLRHQVSSLTKSVKDRFTASSMIAQSSGMRRVITQIEALADTQATVLIRGESGTGKELVAHALHVDSKRSNGPFVAVNCAAFAENLLESELFGHEKGAFTGAVNTYKGAFERADGGTLFLDEIGDAPSAVQVKLLRALESREIRRVGGRDSFHVNVRLVSATNKDLEKMVREETFREDLFYRLNVVTIQIPPLRERVADIRPMADRFIARIAAENDKKITSVQPDFYEALEAYDWPGNVRQLRNAIESAVLLSPDGILRGTSIPSSGGKNAKVTLKATDNDCISIPKGVTLEAMERAVLEQKLRDNNGNRTVTAEQLGLSRRTILRKIKEHNLPY